MLWISFIIIALLVGIDQGAKWAVKLSGLFHNQNISIIPKLVEFRYVENTGAAYGIMDGKMWFFYIMTVIALAMLGFLLSKGNMKTKKAYTFSVSLLIAGALGNAIDRVILGYVIDFIHFPIVAPIHDIFNFYCNPADIYLTFGIILFIIDLLILDAIRNKKKNRAYEKIEAKERENHARENNS